MERRGYRENNRSGDTSDYRKSREGRSGRRGYRVLVEKPGSHMLFIGSRSCTRHKGTEKMELQQEGKLTFLCMDEVDWITGAYLDQIADAAEEVVKEYHPERLILFGGCQMELLSTDFETLTKNLTEQLGIEVRFHKGCHLVGYDPSATE